MKRLIAATIICASAVSCTTCSPSSDVRKYDNLESLVGRNVTVAGYWSAQHEAAGIYLGKRGYRDAPEQCVMVEPDLQIAHGSAVRVSGLLEKSGCGDELICLTVCQPYLPRNAHLIR